MNDIWRGKPIGDGICLENSWALIAPWGFNSASLRQNWNRKKFRGFKSHTFLQFGGEALRWSNGLLNRRRGIVTLHPYHVRFYSSKVEHTADNGETKDRYLVGAPIFASIV